MFNVVILSDAQFFSFFFHNLFTILGLSCGEVALAKQNLLQVGLKTNREVYKLFEVILLCLSSFKLVQLYL